MTGRDLPDIDPQDAPIALLLRTLHDPDAEHSDRVAAQEELLRRGMHLPAALRVTQDGSP